MGMMPADFWALTYAEFRTCLKGHTRTLYRRANEMIYTAWHTALFTRQPELPALKDVLLDEESTGEPREMTDEQMFNMCRLLNAAFGGTEVAL
jgi:hypothetical protein